MKLLSLLIESESFWVNRNVSITATGGPEVFWLNVHYDKNPEDFGAVIQDFTALRFDYKALETRKECLNHLLKHRQFYNENELISIIKTKFAVQPSNNFGNLFFVGPLDRGLTIVPKIKRINESLDLNKRLEKRLRFFYDNLGNTFIGWTSDKEFKLKELTIRIKYFKLRKGIESKPYLLRLSLFDPNRDDFGSVINDGVTIVRVFSDSLMKLNNVLTQIIKTDSNDIKNIINNIKLNTDVTVSVSPNTHY